MKILLIDDNINITKMLSKFLDSKGHKCTFANDGGNGLNLILNQKFDVVLLDLAMPEFTGMDIISALEAKGKLKENKIFIYSASSMIEKAIDDLKSKGIAGYIKKPISLEQLLRTITS